MATRARSPILLALAGLVLLAILAVAAVLVLQPSGEPPAERAAAPRPEPPASPLPRPQASTADPVADRPADVFLAPSGSDEGPCTKEKPCRSLAGGYLAAPPGGVVELAAGSYGDQVIEADPSKQSGEPVTFRPAKGADVVLGGVLLGGNLAGERGPRGITLRDMTIGGFVSQGARDLRVVNVTMKGNFAVQGGSDVAIVGGSAGGTNDGSHSEIVAWVDANGRVEPPERVLVDGVTFHDVRLSRPTDHVECLQVTDAVELTVRNSRFIRCDTFDLRVDRYRTAGPRDLVIANNVFVHTRDRFGGTTYYGLAVRAGEGVRIVANSSDIGWAGPEPDVPIDDWLVAGNVMPGGRCDERIVYRHNLWSGGTPCSELDRVGNPRFRDARAGDLRLLPGSPALNSGDPSATPDVDHRAMPRRGRPDAGAFEGASA